MSKLKITCWWLASREFWNYVAKTCTNCTNACIIIIIITITIVVAFVEVDSVTADHASKIYKGVEKELH